MKIVNGLDLCRNRRHKCHIEIFLPAYHRLIRSTEQNMRKSVTKISCYSRKLHLPLVAYQIDIMIESYIGKASGHSHCIKQCLVILPVSLIRKQVFHTVG